MPRSNNPYDPRDPQESGPPGLEYGSGTPGSGRGYGRFDADYQGPTRPLALPGAERGVQADGQGPAQVDSDDRTLHDLPLPFAPQPPFSAPAPVWVRTAPHSASLPTLSRAPRRVLWIALGTLAALLLVICACAALALSQYTAPMNTVTQFCADLQGARYDRAYGLLGGVLRTHYSTTQFIDAAIALDRTEGRITACASSSTNGGYSYTLGGSSASAAIMLARAKAGTLRGSLALTSEQGAWRVSDVDTSLLGVRLDALVAMDDFCAALMGQSYAAAYMLLAGAAQASVKQADFVQVAQWQDAVDGAVNACDVEGIGAGANDAAVSFAVSATRAKLGQKQGDVKLAVEDGTWRVSSIATSLNGSDLGPLVVGNQFCDDVAKGNTSGLYGLVSPGYLGGLTLTLIYNGVAGIQWSGCTLDATTYKAASGKVSYSASMAITKKSNGQTTHTPVTFQTVQVSGAWKVDNIVFPK
jgi:hypothetical protein